MGVAAYIASGFFLYTVNLLLLFQLPDVSDKAKLFASTLFMIPALIGWAVGLGLRGRIHWRHDTGILLLTVGIVDAFLAFTFYCMFASPEIREAFPSKAREAMSDYRSASACLLAYLFGGAILLVWNRSRRRQALA